MKNLTSFYCTLFAVLLFSEQSMAQLNMDRQNSDVQIPTTQTYEFDKYGNIGATLYTGTINYSLPLYTYHDSDFDLNISIDYATNGYMPNSRTGIAGLGWMLNDGGCITREVRGVPDELNQFYRFPLANIGESYNGFLDLFKKGYNIENCRRQVLVSSSGGIFFVKHTPDSLSNPSVYYEETPDIFHYNFFGHSGIFYLWNNGEIKCFSNVDNDPVRIKISLLANDIDFYITTSDGYRYIFSGGSPEGEYITIKDPYGTGIDKNETMTWRLYSITAPNGRAVKYHYSANRYDGQNFSYTQYNYQPASTLSEEIFGANLVSAQSSERCIKSHGVRSALLDSITISGGPTVRFDYIISQGERKINNTLDGQDNAAPSAKLSSVYALMKMDTLSKCKMSYAFNTVRTPIMNNTIYFLDSVKINGEGSYSFDYNGRTSELFPNLGTFSTDHYGYYNGLNSDQNPQGFIQYLSYSNLNYETINGSLKNCIFDRTLQGTLKKITYPFGGYTLLEYEPNDYSWIVSRDLINHFLPGMRESTTGDPQIGGLRIKSVRTYNADSTLASSKTYFYTDASGTSTGTLLHFPRYGVNYTATIGTPTGTANVKYYSINDYYSTTSIPIEYRSVKEYLSGGGSTIYSYTNYNDYPDLQLFDTEGDPDQVWNVPRYVTSESGQGGYFNFNITAGGKWNVINIASRSASMQNLRGRLKSIDKRDSTGSVLSTSSLLYSTIAEHAYSTPSIVSEYYKMIGDKHIEQACTKKEETLHTSSGNYATSINFGYNSGRQKTTETSIDGTGDTLVVKTDFPADHLAEGSIYSCMVAKGLTSYPITVKYMLKKNGTLVTTGGERYVYGYILRPSGDTLIKAVATQFYDFPSDSWKDDVQFSYDTIGHVTQTVDRDGKVESYVWGYSGLYPVARGSNISSSALLGYINSAGAFDGTNGIDKAKYAAIRSSAGGGASITFYEYKPGVGISAIVEPSGRRKEYLYNKSGKLKEMLDSFNNPQTKILYSTDNKK